MVVKRCGDLSLKLVHSTSVIEPEATLSRGGRIRIGPRQKGWREQEVNCSMIQVRTILTGEDHYRCSMLEYRVTSKDEVQAIPFGMSSSRVWIFCGKDIVG